MKKTLWWWNLNNSLPSLYGTWSTAEELTLPYLYNFYITPEEQSPIKHLFAIQQAAKGTSIKFTLMKFTTVIVSLSLPASVSPPTYGVKRGPSWYIGQGEDCRRLRAGPCCTHLPDSDSNSHELIWLQNRGSSSGTPNRQPGKFQDSAVCISLFVLKIKYIIGQTLHFSMNHFLKLLMLVE